MSVFKPTFANLVASPTDTAWAQAYTAGSLFGVLSLTSKDKTDDAKLKTLGKEVFNVLQAEFFPLEEKNLENVRDAIAASVKNVPADVSVSFVLGFQKDDLLYVFIYGGGKVLLG